MKVVTICGNGIGSSLMCRMKIEEILEEENISVIRSYVNKKKIKEDVLEAIKNLI